MKQTKICRKCKKEFVTYSKYKYLCKKCSVCKICGDKQYGNHLCLYHYQRERKGLSLNPKCVECGDSLGKGKQKFCGNKCYKKNAVDIKWEFYKFCKNERNRVFRKIIENPRKMLERI